MRKIRVRLVVIKGFFVGTSHEEEVEAHVTHGVYFHDRSSELVHDCDFILGLSLSRLTCGDRSDNKWYRL